MDKHYTAMPFKEVADQMSKRVVIVLPPTTSPDTPSSSSAKRKRFLQAPSAGDDEEEQQVANVLHATAEPLPFRHGDAVRWQGGGNII